MNLEQLIADLDRCLAQDPVKHSVGHQANFNAANNKCIGGNCASPETKAMFYQTLYGYLTETEYNRFRQVFDALVNKRQNLIHKYPTVRPTLPLYGSSKPLADYCLYTEDLYQALRLTFS